MISSPISCCYRAQATDYDFSELPAAGLSGFVYLDNNDDGKRDAGDTGLANIALTLFNSGGQPISTATTDSNGFYAFVGLDARNVLHRTGNGRRIF